VSNDTRQKLSREKLALQTKFLVQIQFFLGMDHLVWTEIPQNSRHHLVNKVLSIILQHNTENVKGILSP